MKKILFLLLAATTVFSCKKHANTPAPTDELVMTVTTGLSQNLLANGTGQIVALATIQNNGTYAVRLTSVYVNLVSGKTPLSESTAPKLSSIANVAIVLDKTITPPIQPAGENFFAVDVVLQPKQQIQVAIQADLVNATAGMLAAVLDVKGVDMASRAFVALKEPVLCQTMLVN